MIKLKPLLLPGYYHGNLNIRAACNADLFNAEEVNTLSCPHFSSGAGIYAW
jgi:hypothetical protein